MNSFEIVATRYKEYQIYHSVIISIFLVGYSKKCKVKIKIHVKKIVEQVIALVYILSSES